MVVICRGRVESQDACIGVVIDCYLQEEIDDITVCSEISVLGNNGTEGMALSNDDDIELWNNDEYERECNILGGDDKHRIDLEDSMIWISNCSDESSEISSIESQSFYRGVYEKKGSNVTGATMMSSSNTKNQVYTTYGNEYTIPSSGAGASKNITPRSLCIKSRSIASGTFEGSVELKHTRSIASGTFEGNVELKHTEIQLFIVPSKMEPNHSQNGVVASIQPRRSMRRQSSYRRREVHPSMFRRCKTLTTWH